MNNRFGIEFLEGRRMLSAASAATIVDGELVVNGTRRADAIVSG